MKFIQLIEYTTSQPDEVNSVMDEWTTATQGKREGRHVHPLDVASVQQDHRPRATRSCQTPVTRCSIICYQLASTARNRVRSLRSAIGPVARARFG